jgi:lysyl-tRNA synthetase class 2
MQAIFQICKVFRNGEIGRLHNPEFTMVEWYRVGDGLAEGIQLLSELCQRLLKIPPAQSVSYAAAFQQYANIDPHACMVGDMAAVARKHNLSVPTGFGNERDAWLDLLLTGLVQPRLGKSVPIILYDYPATQAALARVRSDANPPVAERFELYVQGIELANGYHELLDADELRRRNAAAGAARTADGKPCLPETSRLLSAMESGFPACAGAALGFDRVVMLAAGANSLDEVLAFPIDRA